MRVIQVIQTYKCCFDYSLCFYICYVDNCNEIFYPTYYNKEALIYMVWDNKAEIAVVHLIVNTKGELKLV